MGQLQNRRKLTKTEKPQEAPILAQISHRPKVPQNLVAKILNRPAPVRELLLKNFYPLSHL
jgi:hypothetical protein